MKASQYPKKKNVGRLYHDISQCCSNVRASLPQPKKKMLHNILNWEWVEEIRKSEVP